jgi:two-component system, LytTR family, response regulator
MQLKVSVTEGVFILNPEDIICLEANSNYTKLYLIGRRNLFSAKTLKAYQSMLPQNYFYRVHSSFLINKKHISEFCPQGYIALTQNIEVPVARRRKTEVKLFLKQNGLL